MSDKYHEGQRVLIMEAYGIVESYGGLQAGIAEGCLWPEGVEEWRRSEEGIRLTP